MTLEEQLAEQAKKGLLGLGLEQETAEEYAPWAALAAQFIPGVGEGVGIDNTVDAINDERYGDAAIEGGLTLLGAVPVVGDMAAAAIKGIRRAPTSLLDDAVDAGKKVEFDEAAWLKANPRPHPDVRPRDMTPDQNRAYSNWRTKKSQAKNKEALDARYRERYANDAEFREKQKAKGRRSGKSEDQVRAMRARDKELYDRRYSTDPEYREKVRLKNERARAKGLEADPEAYAAKQKAYQATHKEKDPVAWRGKKANAQAKRRASLLERTPSWADPDKIDEIFDTAAEISSRTGVPHEVDHVIPLQGRNVSGLHHQDNLLVVPMKQNRSKHNAFEPGDLPPRAGVRKSRAYLKKLKEAQEAAKRK